MEYSLLANYAALLYNDLIHMQLHAAGNNLNDIRDDASSYSYRIRADYEYFAKKAIINGEHLPNISSVRQYVPETEWKSVEEDLVDINTFTMYLSINGRQYLNAIKNVEDRDEDITRIIRFWEDTICYDNEQRLAYEQPNNTMKYKSPYTPEPAVKELVEPPIVAVIQDTENNIPSWRELGATSELSKSVLNGRETNDQVGFIRQV